MPLSFPITHSTLLQWSGYRIVGCVAATAAQSHCRLRYRGAVVHTLICTTNKDGSFPPHEVLLVNRLRHPPVGCNDSGNALVDMIWSCLARRRNPLVPPKEYAFASAEWPVHMPLVCSALLRPCPCVSLLRPAAAASTQRPQRQGQQNGTRLPSPHRAVRYLVLEPATQVQHRAAILVVYDLQPPLPGPHVQCHAGRQELVNTPTEGENSLRIGWARASAIPHRSATLPVTHVHRARSGASGAAMPNAHHACAPVHNICADPCSRLCPGFALGLL
mmetsp:Transcript_17060/g.52680  ORF Transcript_17060/g.52680 Transcript_17060/m.52680 type:complete len:275 (+) Transcript_17060:187-1011(+)